MIGRYSLAWLILVIAAIINGIVREAVYAKFIFEL